MNMLESGVNAPNIEGKNQEGKAIKTTDFQGKKLVIFFYPKDSTPGCTAEACSLRDNFSSLKQKGFVLLGVSADSAKRHQNFIAKNELPFDLIVDEEKEWINAFGVWGPKKFMGKEFDGIHRTTFIINEKGIIEHVIKKVKTKAHAEQILELYA
jgi:peroxiredoxin Q/BCP